MDVAVTGGSGQLGTLVLRRLIHDRTVKRVVSIDLRPPVIASPKVHAVLGDVRDAHFERHLQDCDVLIHLAFIVTASPPRHVVEAVNVEGSKNVFRAAAAAGVKRIAYASSVAAYGVTSGHPVPIVESSERRYVGDFAYSATKYRVEEFLDLFEKEHPEIAIARFRPGILMGEHMDHPLGAALRSRRMVAVSDAPTLLVWDEDVADAFHLAIKREVRGAFNLVTDDALSPAQLAHGAGIELVKLPRLVLLGFAKASPFLSRLGLLETVDPAWIAHARDKMIVSNDKAKQELGWTPKCPKTADVMRRTLESMHGRTDRRIALFMRLAALSAKHAEVPSDAARMNAIVHLELSGEGGGDWTITVRNGRAEITRGIPRPPTSIIRLGAATFLELLGGRIDYSSAQLTGKVRVEGEPMASLILGGMVMMFRKEQQSPGARGIGARRMAHWFAQ